MDGLPERPNRTLKRSTYAPGQLNARRCETAPDGLHCDGGNLYLKVRYGGTSRAWVYRYKETLPDGKVKARELGLGPLRTVTLAEARKRAAALRLARLDGYDLKAWRAAQLAKNKGKHKAPPPTFAETAALYLTQHARAWSNPKHAAQWASTLETYVYPFIGDLRVDEVSRDDVFLLLDRIWESKPETAGRVRGRVERILDYAAARGWRSNENPARWRGGLEALLPAPGRLAEVKHHAALDYREAPALYAEVRERQGVAALALRFLLLTAARSGEVRGATWSEIDVERGLWIVPPGRMKARKEWRVPLTEAALDALREARAWSDGRARSLVFPGEREGRPLSDMTLGKLLRRMGRDATVHGLRSTFRDWAGETTAHPREVIEHALAHRLKDRAEAAYARGDLLAKRLELMRDWAAYLEGKR